MRAHLTGQSRSRALLHVLACVVCWALIARLASTTPPELGEHNLLLWSNAVSSLVLVGAAAWKRRLGHLRTYSARQLLDVSLLAFLGVSGYYALLYWAYAYERQSAGTLIAVQYTWPALTAVLSTVVLREPTNGRTWMGVLLAVIGVATVLVETVGASAAVPKVACAAVMFAVYSTLSKQRDYEPYSSVALIFVMATAMSVAWGLAQGSIVAPWPHLGLILLNGGLVNGISYVWWRQALAHAPASFLAPWVSMTPVLGTMVLAWGDIGIEIGARQWIGIGLVAGSMLLVSMRSPLPRRLPRSPLDLSRSRHSTAA
jgi:drug/metabolite transporter (DMT)-like permease